MLTVPTLASVNVNALSMLNYNVTILLSRGPAADHARVFNFYLPHFQPKAGLPRGGGVKKALYQ